MGKAVLIFSLLTILCFSNAQVVQFGACSDVGTVEYFQLDSFLGDWYEVQRYPTWYEHHGQCGMKKISYCNRRIEIEHVFVKDGIQFILHVNSSYAPGDEAVFFVMENSVDPVGIPLSIIATNYEDFALVYGCKSNEELNIKYVSTWILSRAPTLAEEFLNQAHEILNRIPGSSTAYLETVMQDEKYCTHYWTAHVEAENVTDPKEFMDRLSRRV